MLRLSKKTEYALLALTYLGTEAPSGVASARTIAERYDIPLELLAKILQYLGRQGFVAAHKGVYGGYHLARSTQTISVVDVILAIDGPFAVTACSPADERCAQFATCTVRDSLWRIKERLLNVLQAITLADICEDDRRRSVPIMVSRGVLGATLPGHAR
jgi:Rrf2 family protein